MQNISTNDFKLKVFASHLHFVFPDKEWLICVLNNLPSWCFGDFFSIFFISLKSFFLSFSPSSTLVHCALLWSTSLDDPASLLSQASQESTCFTLWSLLVMLLITALFLQLSLISQLSQSSLDSVAKNHHWTMLSILTYFTKSNRNAWKFLFSLISVFDMVSHKFHLRILLFLQFLWYILYFSMHMWFCLYMCMHLNMYGCTCVGEVMAIQQVNIEYFFQSLYVW